MPSQFSGIPFEFIVHAAVPVILFKIPFNKHRLENSLPGLLLRYCVANESQILMNLVRTLGFPSNSGTKRRALKISSGLHCDIITFFCLTISNSKLFNSKLSNPMISLLLSANCLRAWRGSGSRDLEALGW